MRTYDPNDTAASISAFVNELAMIFERLGIEVPRDPR